MKTKKQLQHLGKSQAWLVNSTLLCIVLVILITLSPVSLNRWWNCSWQSTQVVGALSLTCNKTEVKGLRYWTLKTNSLFRYDSEQRMLPGATVNCVKEVKSSSKLPGGLKFSRTAQNWKISKQLCVLYLWGIHDNKTQHSTYLVLDNEWSSSHLMWFSSFS